MEKADRFSSISFCTTPSSLPGTGPLGANTTADCFCGVLDAVLKAVPFYATCTPWLQPGEWQEIKDETQFARMILSLANWRESCARAPEGCCLCWVQNSQPTGHAIAWHFRRSSGVCSIACCSRRGWCCVGTGCVQAEHPCVPDAAGTRLLLPQQQQAGLLLALPCLNLAGSEELIAKGVVHCSVLSHLASPLSKLAMLCSHLSAPLAKL